MAAAGAFMMRRILQFLDGLSNRTITVVSIAVTLLVGILDAVTGVEIHFLVFYLLPIALASWFVSRKTGIYLAFVCSVVWLIADWLGGRPYSSPWIVGWNFFMRTGAFVVISLGQSELRAKFDVTSELARRDFLTGLPNGRAFYEMTAAELERGYGIEPLTLAFIDMSGFKWINHRLGYSTGDHIICTIAHAIRHSVPRTDLVARIGGTCFAVLLPNMGSEAANAVLDQVHAR
jgi:predicted signal transduction protein with EAL and GGDEF domain